MQIPAQIGSLKSVRSPPWLPIENPILQKLPFILKGEYTREMVVQVVLYAGGASIGSAIFGMALFARKDL